MRYRSARRIRPELEPLDRRDVPSGVSVSAGSVSAQVASPTTLASTYTGTFRSTEYHGQPYQVTVSITDQKVSGFKAVVSVDEPAHQKTEIYTITGTISNGILTAIGSGPDGTLTIAGQETEGGQFLLTWKVTNAGSVFDYGTGSLTPGT
jgi:hypothetical protein